MRARRRSGSTAAAARDRPANPRHSLAAGPSRQVRTVATAPNCASLGVFVLKNFTTRTGRPALHDNSGTGTVPPNPLPT